MHSHAVSRRFLLGGVLAGGFAARAQASAKPNLVLFLSDDHGYRDSPVYGAEDVRTPSLLALAREGLVFENAFTSSPTCVPSRAILMSGMYPARNGAMPNHSGLTPGIPTMPTYLKALGYEVFHFGKSHFQPPENYPDWTRVPSEIRRSALNSDLDMAAVERWLAERSASGATKPVCMVVCCHSPHVFWKQNQGYDPAAVSLPPTFVDTPETRAERTKYYSDISLADQQLGELLAACRKHLSTNTLYIYTSDNGAQWPFAKWSLYDAGIRMPFVAAWKDVIRPATRTKAMVSFCDVMPTFLELAGGRAPDGLDGRSFARVLHGKANAHRDEIYAAHSGDQSMNVFPCRAVRTARFKYILNLHPEFVYTTHIDKAGPNDGRIYFDSWVAKAKTDPQAAAVVDRYHRHPSEELYDVVADPHEMRNLAASERHQATLRTLREKVRTWMKEQGDDGPVFGTPRLRETA